MKASACQYRCSKAKEAMYLHSPNEKDIRAQVLSSQSYRFHILPGTERGPGLMASLHSPGARHLLSLHFSLLTGNGAQLLTDLSVLCVRSVN